MSTIKTNLLTKTNTVAVERYYGMHSYIYDITRWSFLFGRSRLVGMLSNHIIPKRILEIGCGTGHNLMLLHHQYPDAQLTGIDLSAPMLEIASYKLENMGARFQLLQKSFPNSDFQENSYDLVLCSYALTMFNPGWELAILSAAQLLTINGIFAVVDFHTTPFSWFKKWMSMNHVAINGHLVSMLHAVYSPCQFETVSAYGGLWQYFTFLGCRKY